ncbi:OprD family outer membrane porin [Aestuariispira insulae]|uniref:Outer membrane OprD family porin n=1 Tax=Aestuariispira insulae TaxID=1461337 RepID=A0A3D9HWG0_9PROT|nr:OprD family outer membrane porin [Aestuariispira insulae]RED53755.1 outer membrane OprD family porin [Aestuariispira insulae]
MYIAYTKSTLLAGTALAMLAASAIAPAQADEATIAPLWEDSHLNATLYYWQRTRDRRASANGNYEANLDHVTLNAALDFNSGYAADAFGFDAGIFGATDLANSKEGNGHEMSFHGTRITGRTYDKEASGLSIYKAHGKFKHEEEDWSVKAKAGLQQMNAGTLGVNWSYLPGTYRGVQFDGTAGNFSFNYGIADQYKAPWFKRTAEFRDRNSKIIDYLHSAGVKYQFDDGPLLEAGFGQAEGFMNSYLAKVSQGFDVLDNSRLSLSYQFYGMDDHADDRSSNDVYNGLAWTQAATAALDYGNWNFRTEFTWVKAEGAYGYFLPRMTPSYGSSQGRFDIWWDSRSDWNHDNEKAIFFGATYDMKDLDAPGWKVGASYAYGWDLKGWGGNFDAPVKTGAKESAYNFDVMYTVQDGRFKGTLFKMHYTNYDNQSGEPSWTNYGNLFQDERDVKFQVIVPIEIF